LAKFILQID
jgi:hypothetical protein